MSRRRTVVYWLLLSLAAWMTLLAGMPAADVPVRVYESSAGISGVCGVLSVCLSWGALWASGRRRRDFAAVFSLNLLTALFLCRALWDVLECCSYDVPG